MRRPSWDILSFKKSFSRLGVSPQVGPQIRKDGRGKKNSEYSRSAELGHAKGLTSRALLNDDVEWEIGGICSVARVSIWAGTRDWPDRVSGWGHNLHTHCRATFVDVNTCRTMTSDHWRFCPPRDSLTSRASLRSTPCSIRHIAGPHMNSSPKYGRIGVCSTVCTPRLAPRFTSVFAYLDHVMHSFRHP